MAEAPRPIEADSDYRYDGQSTAALAARLGLPRVELYATIGSTMDAAHAAAVDGAPSGTLILADEQTAGRGRQGSSWQSRPGEGIWLTLLERPSDASGLDVLSLRVGLATARALDRFASDPVRVKWPNDLYVGSGKLGGVLVEARWRGGRPDWVAVGVGVNVREPGLAKAVALSDNVVRLDVLLALIPAIRNAAARSGLLDTRELGEYAERDYARGRRCITPACGIVEGVSAAGELAVRASDRVVYFRAGSLLLEEGR